MEEELTYNFSKDKLFNEMWSFFKFNEHELHKDYIEFKNSTEPNDVNILQHSLYIFYLFKENKMEKNNQMKVIKNNKK